MKFVGLFLFIMEDKKVEYYVNNSKTAKKILSVFFEGASPTRKQIQQLYIKWSKTEARDSHRKKGKRKFRSIRATKMRRADKLYKNLIKINYWNYRE